MGDTLKSVVTAEITCADIPRFIQSLNDAGIELWDVTQTDTIKISLRVAANRISDVQRIAEKQGAQVQIQGSQGLLWPVKRILKRPILILTALIMIVLTFWLPGRIFFVEVEGNSTIPARYILEKAESVGLGFGASRAEVRSEKLKNALLEQIPQLQWVGVNTRGCIATISVREKSVVEENAAAPQIASIVAARDGILLSSTVLRGRQLCNVGQAVKKGDVLVSGYLEHGTITQGCAADAEILALTERIITVKTPSDCLKRARITQEHTCYGLRIGKKLIKFCNHSGIYDATCVKMYSEEYWTLPGGFTLPVAWTFETVQSCETVSSQQTEEADFDWLRLAAAEYTASRMTAGQILSEKIRISAEEGFFSLTGNYTCREMIGQVRYEEILE